MHNILPSFEGIYAGTPGTYTIDDLPGGNYTVSVEDECDRVITILDNEITAYPPMDIRLEEYGAGCEGERAIRVIAEGDGVPQVYEWSTGEIENQNYIENLTIGTYAVTVTDSYDCTESREITLEELKIRLDAETDPGLCIYAHPGGSTVIGMATVNVNLDGVPIPGIGFRYSVTYIHPLWEETEIAEGETSSGVFTFEASDYEYTITVTDDCLEHTETLTLEPEAEVIDFIQDDPSSFGDWNCEETINGCNGHDEITFFIGMATPEYPALVPQNGGFSDWLVVDTDNCSYKLLCLDGSEMESYTHPETFEVTQLSGNGDLSDPIFDGFFNPDTEEITCFERRFCEFNIDIVDPVYGYPIKGRKSFLESQDDVSAQQPAPVKIPGTKDDDGEGNGCPVGSSIVTVTCGGVEIFKECIPGCAGTESYVFDNNTCLAQQHCDGVPVGTPTFVGTTCFDVNEELTGFIEFNICELTGSPVVVGIADATVLSADEVPVNQTCCAIYGPSFPNCGAFAPSDTIENRQSIQVEGQEGLFIAPFTLNAYPNPFTDVLNVEIESNINTQVAAKILNLMGQVIYFEELYIEKGQTKINLKKGYSNLQPGIYFLSVEDEDHNRKSMRIIKI